MQKRMLTVLTLSLFAGACVRTRVTPFDLSAGVDARTPVDSIKFFAADRPKCSYRELGQVTSQSRFLASWSSIVEEARKEAHAMGGDAIISVRESTRISGATISKAGISTSETTSLSGVVIRFLDSGCRT